MKSRKMGWVEYSIQGTAGPLAHTLNYVSSEHFSYRHANTDQTWKKKRSLIYSLLGQYAYILLRYDATERVRGYTFLSCGDQQ